MTRRDAVQLPLLVAVLGAVLPLSGSSYLLGIGFSLCCWIALVQSWTVLSAMAGYVSLGHVVFYGLGAYVVALSWGVLPLPVALVLAGAVAGAFALLVGLPVLRVRGPYFVILTFGIAELVKYVVILIESRLGEFSRLMFGAPDLPWLYAIALGLAVAATLGAVLIRGSRLGRGLLALRENEEAAETVGVPTTRLKLIAFVLSSIIPGIVGGLVALRTAYFEPMQAFDPTVSFTIVTMAVVGGSDDARGPLLGAAFFTLLSELLWARLPQFYMVVLGLLLIFFVLFIPSGIAGIVRRQLRAEPVVTGLAVEQVSKSFGGLRVLSDISFTVAEGETVGIMGANGAGKTTLFSLIAGHGRPDAGDIRLGSRSLLGLSPDRICRLGIARTFQIVKPFGGLSVLDNVVVAALYGNPERPSQGEAEAQAASALAAVGLADRAGDLAETLTLSGQKRLEVARALGTGARFLLLDEVMAGLTPTEVAEMLGLIAAIRQRHRLTLLIIEHVMRALMQQSDRILVLHHGELIAAGDPEAIARDPTVLRVYYGEDA